MNFLQPLMLAALPLVSLPLIIHLINQRRFQTVPWAAMMFLMTAKALSRGYSRLRNWLIMAMRMAAIAALLFAVGRPLSRGWLALAGGARPDLAVVILDRSPSMQQRSSEAADTKLETGRRQLVESLQTLGASRCVLFTDPAAKPIELTGPAQIADLPVAGPAAAATDIPMLMQSVYDYVVENRAGTTEVWICSDQRQNDWSPENGVWGGLRDAFAKLPQQVRFQLLSYDEPATDNVAVRVTDTKVEKRGADRELLVTVATSRLASGDKKTLPLRFEIGGVASTVELELVGREAVLKNHAIPLERAAGSRGWGKVSIPADSNAADNEFYFVFDEPALRKTLVVAPDPVPARRDSAGEGAAGQGRRDRPRRSGDGRLGGDGAASLAGRPARGEGGRSGERVREPRRPGDLLPPGESRPADVRGDVVDRLDGARSAHPSRPLAQRPGPVRQHALRWGAAGGRSEDPAVVRRRRRPRHAGAA
jgi:hypothetical protein